MSWIKTISYENASASLKKMYDRVKGPDNNIDNVLQIHSLRPHSLVGHMTLYKSVLHHSANTLPKWYLEALGVYVSSLNECSYCVAHHFQGFKRLFKDDKRADLFLKLVKEDNLKGFFEAKELEGIRYAKILTCSLSKITQKDIDSLISKGFTEGEVLEINQVCSYFNYVNRSVVGLGVSTDGDIIGLSPNESDDPSNWNHS